MGRSIPSRFGVPSERLYYRVREVACLLGVKPSVLRYWEAEFPSVQPDKSPSGQRIYRQTDVESLLLIKHLLYKERYSIAGARQRLRQLRRSGELKVVSVNRARVGEILNELKKLQDAIRAGNYIFRID